jgi:hypothetical protein
MKTIRKIPALLFVCLLVWSVTARGQMAMDSMHVGSMGSMSAAARTPGAGTEDSTRVDDRSSTASHKAKLVLAVRDGDSTWIVRATLTAVDSTGKEAAVPKATVSFFVQRLFGVMPIGEENTAVTDDSGASGQAFPKNFPEDAIDHDGHGLLTIVARVEDNDQTGPVEARVQGNWGAAVPIVADPFPRALWEPRAPIAMIITFLVLLGGVWATYGFILSQLFYIKKGKHDEA